MKKCYFKKDFHLGFFLKSFYHLRTLLQRLMIRNFDKQTNEVMVNIMSKEKKKKGRGGNPPPQTNQSDTYANGIHNLSLGDNVHVSLANEDVNC